MNTMSLIHYLSNRTSIDDYANKVGYGLAGIVGIVAITLFTMMPLPKAEREEVVKKELVRRRKETPGERIRNHKKGLSLYKTPERIIRARKRIREMQSANYQYQVLCGS